MANLDLIRIGSSLVKVGFALIQVIRGLTTFSLNEFDFLLTMSQMLGLIKTVTFDLSVY